MPIRLLPITSKKLPPPRTSNSVAPAGTGFAGLEWNALINRARSLLKALGQCQTGTGGLPCRTCPMAEGGSEERPGGRMTACRSNFRALEQRLAHLARQAPEPERQQLRRTVDGLHLAYRDLDLQEDRYGRDIRR